MQRENDVPLPDASFDLAVSEYGASLWADPYKWIPEAARLLRPGGVGDADAERVTGLPVVAAVGEGVTTYQVGDRVTRCVNPEDPAGFFWGAAANTNAF